MPAAITVIIPTRNAARLLPEAVHSVLDQSRYVDEVIVIDHGTDAETPAIAEQLKDIMGEAPAGSSIARFHYQRTDNAGTGAAINTALASATGDYVWVIGAKNRALSHGAETLARMLDDAPDLTFAAGAYRRFKIHPRSRKQTDLAPTYWPDLRQGAPLRHLLEDRFLPGDAVMVRRSALTAAGPFREDAKGLSYIDMQIRLACLGPVQITEDPVFLQRMSDDSQKSNQNKPNNAVMTAFRERIPLSMYEGMFLAEDPKIVRRAAHLQRACVYARQSDWDIATRDFVDAAKLAPAYRLSQLEKDICARALSSKHGVGNALTSDVRSALREAASMSAAGGSIARALSGGMAWRSKDAMARGRIGNVASMGKFVSALRIYTGGHGRGERPGQVSESKDLPPNVYKVV